MSGRGTTREAARHLAEAQFGAAHQALLDDPAVQFQPLRTPPPAQPPGWLHDFGEWIRWALRPIGHVLRWIGQWLPNWPFARLLLWSVLALLAAAVVWMAVERVRHGEWRLPRWCRRRLAGARSLADEPWTDPGPVHAWLREADALAELGRFAEAAHLLLFRCVEDLARRRPGSVKAALTARELAAVSAFPPGVRHRFAAIAELVERSLFGGRTVGADEWQTARASYAELASPGAWRP